MALENLPEYWLRGPVPQIPPLLQPIAHALLQARDEVSALIAHFDERLLWQKPADMASPGFHLQHLSGVLDRLFTYATGLPLTPEQLQYLKAEGKKDPAITAAQLVQAFEYQVEKAL